MKVNIFWFRVMYRNFRLLDAMKRERRKWVEQDDSLAKKMEGGGLR
jgi:hypothetical protein